MDPDTCALRLTFLACSVGTQHLDARVPTVVRSSLRFMLNRNIWHDSFSQREDRNSSPARRCHQFPASPEVVLVILIAVSFAVKRVQIDLGTDGYLATALQSVGPADTTVARLGHIDQSNVPAALGEPVRLRKQVGK
jgi:hypothetical protein